MTSRIDAELVKSMTSLHQHGLGASGDAEHDMHVKQPTRCLSLIVHQLCIHMHVAHAQCKHASATDCQVCNLPINAQAHACRWWHAILQCRHKVLIQLHLARQVMIQLCTWHAGKGVAAAQSMSLYSSTWQGWLMCSTRPERLTGVLPQPACVLCCIAAKHGCIVLPHKLLWPNCLTQSN